nr:immunoglobulin heavy chain junction region [Macaca mulatta]MOW76441.1 immunoglobulin heavy chain junction region [Macaca mulatta]MOW77039.1 immunoglobulin heavy chain junction region [Macaca mulatta]MOW78003.1 immunoglobulin heavy chain junction region [Macaca mulatta]MOW79180.1 immunoglobulin heavy chain junction region [Macaca mulatta]
CAKGETATLYYGVDSW